MTQLNQVIQFAKQKLNNEVTAHDYSHSERVMKIAKYIGEQSSYGVDLEIIQVASITHDIIDKKVAIDVDAATKELISKLIEIGYEQNQIDHILDIIQNMSYSTGRIPKTEEGKIVQDADRLEAIGAIAIARTFAYGGKLNRLIYEKENDNCSIAHFYDKLLLLKDMMNTEAGKQIATKRHEYMKNYLEQFYFEWNLEDLN
jgi:uncharacterized protein